MANENSEMWGAAFWVNMEAVRATLVAYAEGRIELGKMPAKVKTSVICNAPSVIACDGDDYIPVYNHPYTKQQVAEFLGWTSKQRDRVQLDHRCKVAFHCLEAVERGLAKPTDFMDMGITTADDMARSILSEYKLKMQKAAEYKKTIERKKKRK